MMTERERDRRAAAIEEMLLKLDRDLALLDDRANTPDTRFDRERIELEQDRLRREREELVGPPFTPELARAYINQMWDVVGGLETLMRRMVYWMIGLSVVTGVGVLVMAVILYELVR